MSSFEPNRKWIYRADRLATYVVWFAGIATILSVFAILFFISIEALPLLKGAKVHENFESTLPAGLLDVGQDEHGEIAYLVTDSGTIDFISLKDGGLLKRNELKAFSAASGDSTRSRIVPTTAAHSADSDLVSIGGSDGRVIVVQVKFRSAFEGDTRQITYAVTEEGVWRLGEPDEAIISVAARRNEDYQYILAALTNRGRLLTLWFDSESEEQALHDLTPQLETTPTTIALSDSGEQLAVGASRGEVYHWSLSDPETPELRQRFQATASATTPVTALKFLIGEESLVVGDAEGRLGIFFRVREIGKAGQLRFAPIRSFGPQKGKITHIAVSPRNKGFLAADDTGEIRFYFSTSHRTLLTFRQAQGRPYREHKRPIQALAFAPKGNGAVSLDASGMLRQWKIDAPHPEVSFQILFGKVWYESYPRPEYVWQTTGASETEPKFSLIPLIFGTFKATLYAMCFSVPAALMGAIYTSQFAPAKLRAVVKPVVELMASIPSVVIGFLAGLWLAPLLEKMLVTTFLVLILLPIVVLAGVLGWQFVPSHYRNRVSPSVELGVILLVIAIGAAVSHLLSGPVEIGLLGGDAKGWLAQTLGVSYDNRNAIVVGFALGFAVIPIIYTLAEDALSNVPQSLISAALALGASRAQAALRVVLPAASPGVFAAVMLGLGRAVGETMIVLMASGNAPVIDWSAFIGMRTMSAAIAIEIPEAPRGDTLYRILFLAAALLFLFTFAINTLSDLLSNYLRKRYSRF
jgi:phosphate transport system permease protein